MRERHVSSLASRSKTRFTHCIVSVSMCMAVKRHEELDRAWDWSLNEMQAPVPHSRVVRRARRSLSMSSTSNAGAPPGAPLMPELPKEHIILGV